MSGWNTQYSDPRLIPDRIVRMLPPEERQRLGRHCATAEERQARIDAKSEKELQERIASLLRQRQIEFFRQRMDRQTTGTVGWPDFTFCLDGLFCAVEVKLPGQHPTAEQLACMARLMRDGAFVRVVRSEAEFLACLAEAQARINREPFYNRQEDQNPARCGHETT